MNILYFFFAYILISTIVIGLLYRRWYINDKNHRLSLDNPSIDEMKLEETETENKIVDDKIEEPKVNLNDITSPDKDKPFAKISSPSAIETAEFEKIAGPSVGILPDDKPKRKYTKKQKS